MKRILLMALMAAVCAGARAQALNEGALRGYWQPVEGDEVPAYYDVPHSIWFKEDGTCEYTTAEGTLHCSGYTIGSEGHCLHLFSATDFRGNTAFMMVNLQVWRATSPDGYRSCMTFSSYDAKTWKVRMISMGNSPTSVRSAVDDGREGSAKHDLRGVATDSPRGVYVQDGRKRLAR